MPFRIIKKKRERERGEEERYLEKTKTSYKTRLLKEA